LYDPLQPGRYGTGCLKPTTVISLRRWDQSLLVSSLAGLTLLAWAYLLYHDQNMLGMDAGTRPWRPGDFFMMFLMWAIMMMAMMLPTALRAILIYARIAAQGRQDALPITPIYIFSGAYIAIWTLFSVAATLMQWGLQSAALLSPMMVSSSAGLGAALLITAGIYQFTPLKEACLKHCQSPIMYLAANYKRGNTHAFQLGLKHGSYCLGCCWVLMGLLFLGGVMNLLWILAITLFILAEKLLPPTLHGTQLSGVAMILAGIAFLVGYPT
jgi:predicted metal-binding membrane protein